MSAYVPLEFAPKVLDGLKAIPFARVAIPCGRSMVGAVEALRTAAFDRDKATVVIDLRSIVTEEGFLGELSAGLGCVQTSVDVEGLVAATNGLCQPRLVIILRLVGEQLISQVIKAARLCAEVTRDLAAPISFIWLHDASQASAEPTVLYDVWPAEWRDIPQLEFSGGLDTVIYRALWLYLDRRVYWEAAGQSDKIRELGERVSMIGGIGIGVRPVDDDLNRIFDSTPIPEENRRAASSCLADPVYFNHWLNALRQFAFPKVDVNLVQHWTAAGVVWRPPGFSRWRITPMCLRILADDTSHPITARVGRSLVVARTLHARANPQISQMALVLTTQVELELLDALRVQIPWETLLDACGLRDDLDKSLQRAQQCQDSFMKMDNCLLDFATFGQLVHLAQAAGPTLRFPLSRELLWDIVNLRNLAAHGHPVRWEGLRKVVEAVYSLSEG